MLSDDEFVIQSMTLNLFYLANIRGFCLKITLSFLDKECIKKAKEFVFKSEEIGNIFIDKSFGIIPKYALDSKFLVTEYTLDCENLTKKLFGVDLDTTLTDKLLLLKTASPQKITNDIVELMVELNKKTYALAQEYIIFLKEIFDQEKTNELFSYASPFLIKEIINTIEIFLYTLERTIRRMPVNPTFISHYEYRLINIMESIATFISGMVDPDREDIFKKARLFSIEFAFLKKAYLEKNLSPKNQKKLNNITKKAMIRFSNFISDIISDVLKADLYVTIESIFLDDFYRGANYFIYNLTLIEIEAKKY